MVRYILAIDQGTTGSRAVLFSQHLQVIASAYHEIRQYYPQPGWVEHDPEEIWHSVVLVIEEVIKQAGIATHEIAAVGLANQRETCLLWDRVTGEPVHRAIVWQCRRTASLCERLQQSGLEGYFKKKTGLMIDAYFSGTKVQWLLDHVPTARTRAESGDLVFGTIDTWLVWKLTNGKVHITDHTNASRTLLYNIHDRTWDGEILDRLGIPRSLLPEVQNSAFCFGLTAAIGPLMAEIPITGIAGDQQAALVGQGCFSRGKIKNTYGTGCFLMMNTGLTAETSQAGMLTTIACDDRGRPVYALEGSVFIAGALIQWLRDGLQLIKCATETDAIARSVNSSEGVYIVPAFVGLGAPYWDMTARGLITGITRGTCREHIIRAALESIAFQTYDLITAMLQDSQIALNVLKVDGGAARNDFLMQFQADILDCEIIRPVITESTALGAAYLAGLAADVWSEQHEFEATQTIEKNFLPRLGNEARQNLLAGWQAAVQQVLCHSSQM